MKPTRPTGTGSYDVAYQEWLAARLNGDFAVADGIRTEFERDHGLTIFAEGTMPVEGVTVRRMPLSRWNKLYGDPAVGNIIATADSAIRRNHAGYRGLLT